MFYALEKLVLFYTEIGKNNMLKITFCSLPKVDLFLIPFTDIIDI